MPAPASTPVFDCAIVGAGPAGCSAASWLAQLGHEVALIERAPRLCAGLEGFGFPQSWLLGAPNESLAALGARFAAQVEAQPGVRIFRNHEPQRIEWRDGLWHVDGEALKARTLLVATGLRPRRPAPLFPASERVLDALTLTQRREQLPAGSVLLLGGGDNAVENALYLAERGHRVTIWSRSQWRAQAQFARRLEADSRIVRRPATPLPARVDADGAVHSAAFGAERFDHVAVLLGYEPEPGAWQRATAGLPPLPGFADAPRHALFVAGDAGQRQHPCVQTALADGVVAAKRIEAHLAGQAELQRGEWASHHRQQVIHITGLRFGANLGILDFEREGPQPIQVDAALNLGPQAMVSRDSDIGHVLDYRRIRQIIIDECTAEHTDLLEALVAKLCTRLMKLPGAVGVRVKVDKLEIFPDCQVAISAETGAW
ncbi:MAG: dihydroneopterin aldolase [Pelomonas sp.]|nr:dihydroneopterin aldolase [Roseateles sp.]